MIQKAVIFTIISLYIVVYAGCKIEENNSVIISTIPDKVYIDIPGSLSSNDLADRFKSLTGDSVYNYMRYFIWLSENSNIILQKTYNRLAAINNEGINEFAFTGLDGMTKFVSVQKNYKFNGDTIDFYMEIFDQNYADLALVAFWNKDPLNQLIIFNPSKLNNNEMTDHPDAIIRLEYSVPKSGSAYDTISTNFICGLNDSAYNNYMPDNILIKIGKKGNILDITGSTNNPNARFFDDTYTGGRNWTFLAKADATKNIASAWVALPPSWLSTTENIFTDYSIHQVFADEIRISRPDLAGLPDDELFAAMGINPNELESPGYFDENGFLSAGSSVPSGYTQLINFDGIEPIIPIMVRDSVVQFPEKK